MKKTLTICTTALLLITFSTAAFAAGTGSGGVPQANNTPTPKEEPAPTPAPKPQPVEICNDIENIKERIGCRLEKTEEELKKEPYMPEECRVITEESGKQDCINRYLSLKPCWEKQQGKERISCVKEKLGLPQKLVTAKAFCKDQDSVCVIDYRQLIYHLITFRFYDAEERVEKWYDEGKLNLEITTDFVSFIATSKIIFNNAKSKNERLEVIKEVISRWNQTVEFVKSSKSK